MRKRLSNLKPKLELVHVEAPSNKHASVEPAFAIGYVSLQFRGRKIKITVRGGC